MCKRMRIVAQAGKSSNWCYELARQYDEFSYLTIETFPIKFDSKENLNAKYHGNMFYYFK
jgi:hypothetical protein